MILSIDLSRLVHGQFSQFTQDILNLTTKYDPVLLEITTPFNAFKKGTTEFEALFLTARGNVLTEELQQLDMQRDDAINGFRNIVRGYTFSADPVARQHANALAKHLNLFGNNIAVEEYSKETALLRNIVNDWDTQPILIGAVVSLGLLSWRDQIKQTNSNFERRFLQRSEENGLADAASLKAKRVEINNQYYDLRDTINAHWTLDKTNTTYVTFIKALNGVITKYNEIMARGGGGTTDDTTTPETPKA